MGNSTSLGQGGSEALDKRDMEGEEFRDGRPPEITKLAEEKPIQEEPSNSKLPQAYRKNGVCQIWGRSKYGSSLMVTQYVPAQRYVTKIAEYTAAA